jgi:hypothetical protein
MPRSPANPERKKVKSMWQHCTFLVGFLIFAGPLDARAQQTRPAKSAGPIEYDLLVGGEEYPAIPDQPFIIVTPEGREVEVVLKRREFLRFVGHGVQFSYPRRMRVSVKPDLGVATISAETTESTIVVIQVYSAAASLLISEDRLADELIDHHRTSFKAVGIRLLDDKPERVILGKKRVGSKLRFELAGLTNTVEIYTFKQAGRTVGLVLQNDHEDVKEASECFEAIVSSLEMSRSKPRPATQPASQPRQRDRESHANR